MLYCEKWKRIQSRKGTHMYKVFQVEENPDRWEIFWCPQAPIHFNDRVPYDGKKYSTRAAAYRRVKQLNDELARRRERPKAETCA
jgi:hypothetical protein